MPPAFWASDDLQSNGCLAGGFRTKDFNDPAARESAHTQRVVERNRAGRDGRDGHDRFFRSKPHDGTFAKLLLNLAEGKSESAAAFFFVHAG